MRTVFVLLCLFFVLTIFSPKAVLAQACTYNPVDVRGNCPSGKVCSPSGSSTTTSCQTPQALAVTCNGYPNPAVINTVVEWRYTPNHNIWNQNTASWTWRFDDGTTQNTAAPQTFARKAYTSLGIKTANVTLQTDTPQSATSPDCQITVVAAAATAPAPTNTSTSTTSPPGGGFCGIGEGEPEKFVGKLFGCGVGLVGGVAILFIIYGGFLLLVSAGDPGRVRIGKEYITYAVVGLLLAIFTLVVIQIIGVDILKIPGLGS